MTLLYPFLIFVLGVGISQADESCNPPVACREEVPPYMDGFPEDAEGFDKLCEFLVSFTDCIQREAEKCDSQPDMIRMIEKGHSLVLRMCNQDTLLNKALRENVECIHSNLGRIEPCSFISFYGKEESEDVIESLSENGVTLTEEEDRHHCLTELVVGSCFVATAGELCGEVVKDAVMEIMYDGVNALNVCSKETLENLSIIVETLGPKMTKFTLADLLEK